MPTTRTNGVDLYWELSGTGAPMVLVHGSWGDHHNWGRVVPGLARSFRVLVYDRRGHSLSERPAGQGSVRDDVADLAALLIDLEHAPAHVIGSSFGASIVLRLAGERPDLFQSLVVHEPPLFQLLDGHAATRDAFHEVEARTSAVVARLAAGDSEGGARQFVETVAFGPGAWAALPSPVRETFVFNAPTWLDEARDNEVGRIDLDRLRRCPAPALLTVGTESPPFFPLVVDTLSTALPHVQSHTYQGAGHTPHLSHPDEYVRIVTDFISSAR